MGNLISHTSDTIDIKVKALSGDLPDTDSVRDLVSNFAEMMCKEGIRKCIVDCQHGVKAWGVDGCCAQALNFENSQAAMKRMNLSLIEVVLKAPIEDQLVRVVLYGADGTLLEETKQRRDLGGTISSMMAQLQITKFDLSFVDDKLQAKLAYGDSEIHPNKALPAVRALWPDCVRADVHGFVARMSVDMLARIKRMDEIRIEFMEAKTRRELKKDENALIKPPSVIRVDSVQELFNLLWNATDVQIMEMT